MNRNGIARVILAIFSLLIIGGLVWFFAIKNGEGEQKDEEKVAATIFPLYDITRQIAGDKISIVLVLPSGASPHTFEPTVQTMKDVSDAKILFSVGAGLDSWAETIGKNAGVRVVQTSDGMTLIKEVYEEEPESHNNEEHGAGNPHVWLDIPHAIAIMETITRELSAEFPQYAADFQQNRDRYLTELQAADAEIRQILTEVENPKIITFHDSFPYFAQTYGLELVGTFEPSPGQEPTPQYLKDLRETIQRADVPVIYSEPQMSTAQLEPFVHDMSATIAELDPIGGTGERDTYLHLMIFNAKKIAEHQ